MFIAASITGFIIGGLVGLINDASFSPACWYGILISWCLLAGVDMADLE